MDIRTVLIAVDGSAHARKAALVGAMIAEKFGARIILLHVLLRDVALTTVYEVARSYGVHQDALDKFKVTAPPLYDFGLTVPTGVIQAIAPTELLVEVGNRILETEKAVIEGQGVRTVETVIADDDAASKIIEIVEKEKVDFAVMGRRGLGVLQGMLAGSVSTKVSHHVRATVVSVT